MKNACATVEFLEKTPEFISPLIWPPPNSPDLNPVDYRYSVWSILQEKVYKTRITYLECLKHRIRTEWAMLDRPLSACVSLTLSGRAVVISSTAINSDIVLKR